VARAEKPVVGKAVNLTRRRSTSLSRPVHVNESRTIAGDTDTNKPGQEAKVNNMYMYNMYIEWGA
jgi:hypothetical protein